MTVNWIVSVEDLYVTYRVRRPHGRRSILQRDLEEIPAIVGLNCQFPKNTVSALIGGNGAGKSTLLRAIIGSVRPQSGRIICQARPYLLTPGLGFNKALSGRENIMLSGLASGLSRNSVKELEDEIIGFADIGTFIELPVSTYSSGMQARLGLAIATHVNAELVLIDEALSAGDASFRDKATAKIREICESRSVILVSHSSSVVADLAEYGVWLDRGSARATGPIGEVAEAYAAHTTSGNTRAQARPA